MGIQEGRSRRREVRSGLHYDMFAGQADEAGSAGCQVWVRRALRFRLGEFLTPDHRMTIVIGEFCSSGALASSS